MTTTDSVRAEYLSFFKSSPRSHIEISAAPLVLENDPTTLFTSSGMQPLVPYLLGKPHPEGRRLVNSQPVLRTQDINEVGDLSHMTFFEMLGNWSLGDPEKSGSVGAGYFKKEQLSWFWEFLTRELGLPEGKLWVSVFGGSKDVPRDEESESIWKKLGIPDRRIVSYGVKENWWSRSGLPNSMPAGEIGGPDSEVFYEFNSVKHDPKYGKECGPACDCGRFLEIGNSVFIEYKKEADGSLSQLSQKNVDFGGGLERLTAATNNNPDVFSINAFSSSLKNIEKLTGKSYQGNPKSFRIIADHLRAANALSYSGVVPGNKQQGYVMRRLIRRAVVKFRNLKGEVSVEDFEKLSENREVAQEVGKFIKTMDKGLRELGKLEALDGKAAFDLYQTFGFPLELTLELAEEKGQKVDTEEFKKAFETHQDMSRTASAGKFRGGLADVSAETTALHTMTHLLHEALRRVLGKHVSQKGSNITSDRLRFDFSHDKTLTSYEIKKVEEMINEQIDKNLKVTKEIMTLDEAKSSGALAFFEGKYDEKVNVYSIGEFSKEVCGGPHVSSLSELGGHATILKQGSAGAGVRRIYAKIN